MSAGDFPALRGLVRDSLLGKAVRAAFEALSAAAASSLLVRGMRGADSARRAMTAKALWQMVGALTAAAGITHLVLAELQAAHQVPIAAPAVSGLAITAGTLMATAGPAVGGAWPRSLTRRAWESLIK